MSEWLRKKRHEFEREHPEEAETDWSEERPSDVLLAMGLLRLLSQRDEGETEEERP